TQQAFEPFEKAFDLPAPPIHHRNEFGWGVGHRQIGSQTQFSSGGTLHPDHSHSLNTVTGAPTQLYAGLADHTRGAVGLSQRQFFEHGDDGLVAQAYDVGAALSVELAHAVVVLRDVAV